MAALLLYVPAGLVVLVTLVRLSVGPALESKTLAGDAVAAAVAYPVGDFLVLFAVALVLRRGIDAGVRRSMYLIAAGMLFEIIGNSYLGYLRSQEGWIRCDGGSRARSPRLCARGREKIVW